MFDLGALALVLRDYVDVEGSGRGVTTITSTIRENDPVVDPVTGATLAIGGGTIYGHPGVHAEGRELLAKNTATSHWGNAFYLRGTGARLTRVDAEVDSANGGTGVMLDTSSETFDDLSIRLKAASTFGSLVGVFAAGAAPQFNRVRVNAEVPSSGLVRGVVFVGSAGTVSDLAVAAPVSAIVNQASHGVVTTGGTPRISNARIKVGGAQCYGVTIDGSAQTELRDVVAEASSGYTTIGLQVNHGSQAKAYGSRFQGSGSPSGAGVVAASGTTAILEHSVSEGTNLSYSAPAGILTFAASQLIGTRAGTATCVYSWDGGFLALHGPC